MDHSDEIIGFSQRLLKEAKLSGEYFGAINNLCRAYKCQGNLTEAKRYASMAGRYIGTENQLMIHLLEGENAACFCQWNIQTLIDLIASNAKVMLQKGTFTNQETLRISLLIIKLFSLIYEDGKFGFYHCRVSDWSMKTAKCYAQMQNKEKTLQYLNDAIRNAIQFDSLQDGCYTAPIVNRLRFSEKESSKAKTAAIRNDLTDSCFDFIRNSDAFQQLQQTI